MDDQIANKLLELIQDLTTEHRRLNAEVIATRTALVALLSLEPNRPAVRDRYEQLMALAREDKTYAEFLPQAETLLQQVLSP